MQYNIVFDTSADQYSTQRRYVTIGADRLAERITSLVAKGRIIYEVRRVA